MKEKIIETLIYFENYVLCSDMVRSQLADDLTKLFNQEVEKRIKKRMPSDEEIRDELCRHLYNWLEHNSFKDACRWLRSRLTCSEKPNNSQKTEGGAK